MSHFGSVRTYIPPQKKTAVFLPFFSNFLSFETTTTPQLHNSRVGVKKTPSFPGVSGRLVGYEDCIHPQDTTVDGSEIRRKPTWDVQNPVNNGINYL